MGSVSGTLATMGCAVPYAIAAKIAYPDRLVIALAGDGAMQMNGMAELITIAKYWERWSDPRLIVMVSNNRDLAFVTWEERIQAGDPKWESSQSLPDVPYAEFAKSLGFAVFASRHPIRSARLGTRRSPLIVRWYSILSPILTFRRFLRTSLSSKPATS